jgi:SAM-dependent methyltransferase
MFKRHALGAFTHAGGGAFVGQRDLCQHGFADMAQLGRLVEVAGITPESNMLDVGCGISLISEYLSNAPGAHVHGVDNVPEAIRQAIRPTTGKRAQVTFGIRSLDHHALPPRSFQTVVAIDSLYFTDPDHTARQIRRILASGGRLLAHYSYALRDHPQAGSETLAADSTPLAEALRKCCFEFEHSDFTDADYRHALLRRRVLAELEPEFANEGNLFLYENRLGEANGISHDIEAGTHRRYLYAARFL